MKAKNGGLGMSDEEVKKFIARCAFFSAVHVDPADSFLATQLHARV